MILNVETKSAIYTKKIARFFEITLSSKLPIFERQFFRVNRLPLNRKFTGKIWIFTREKKRDSPRKFDIVDRKIPVPTIFVLKISH